MNEFFAITLALQFLSALFLGWLIYYFARIYQQRYLYHWAYSFFSLAVFLLGALIGVWLLSMDVAVSSPVRLINLFLLSFAGYLQILFIITGTITLVTNKTYDNQVFLRWITVCLLFALFVTLYKTWSDSSVNMRYFMRIGLRFMVAGLAFISIAVYILRKDRMPLFGKKLVIIGFFIYGMEMMGLGLLNLNNLIFGNSPLLFVLAPFQGLFELLVYPLIAVSLVMWFLEVERNRNQEALNKLQNLNHTDALTGLANQQALIKHIMHWGKISSDNDSLSMALFGVDKMQRINDAAGIKKGDQLLVLLSKRLKFLCTGFRFYGRLYGDVFVVLIDGFGKEQTDKLMALRRAMSRPTRLKSETYHLDLSVGLVQITPDLNIDQSLYRASQALQWAKLSGGKRLEIYDEKINLPNNPDLTLESELRAAFKRYEFEIFYQPIWSSKNRIICFEALVRWKHPTRGLLSPTYFLYLVQQLGLIIELDFWMAEQAIKQVHLWKKKNPQAAKVTVNLSAETIQNSSIVQHIKTSTLKYQVNPQTITIEITENIAIHNVESGKDTLNELRNLGIQIAIDDFGAGYSSLNYLRSFPCDVIKFDRSFVSETGQEEINREILNALVPLCHRLHKKVVLEGIENQYQFESLSQLKIDGYQGDYLSFAVPEEQATKMLTIGKRQTSLSLDSR